MANYLFGDPRLPQRFWDKVQVVDSGCWEWTRALFQTGYGAFQTGTGTAYAHRLIYSSLVGSLEELDVDHLCRNRSCVNPHHLEAVTRKENVRRGAMGFSLTGKCRSGLHEVLTDADIYVRPSGRRECRKCMRVSNRRATAKYRQKRVNDG